MEALLGLLVFAALFAAIGGVEKNADGAGFARIAKQQALQDLLEVGVRNYGREMIEFSRGNESAKNFLQEKYAALVPGLGNFCFKLFSEGNSIEANCGNNAARENGEVLGARRILYGGENFFEVRAELS